MAGVFLSLAGTKLTWKERLFTMLAYTPKATVQAAIQNSAFVLKDISAVSMLSFVLHYISFFILLRSVYIFL